MSVPLAIYACSASSGPDESVGTRAEPSWRNSGGTGGSSSGGTGGTTNSGGTGGTTNSGGTGGYTNSGGSGGTGGTGGFGGSGGTGGGGGTAFTMALRIPPVLAPTSQDATTDRYNLTVRSGTVQMRPGNLTPVVGFNGLTPGPTIIATRGRTVTVTQTNAWTENITIHNHGHKVAASSDGHPTDYIVPGASKVYTYPNDQLAATYWYHDHTMDLTGPHLNAGLSAFYVIRDPAEDSLSLPSGAYDVPLVIQDKVFNSDNTLAYDDSDVRRGFMGDTPVIDGVASPYFEVATHKYRFRLLNGSNARNYRIKLQSGRSFQVIASDGGLLTAPVTKTALDVAPAERYDIVVDFGQVPVGTVDYLTNADGGYPSIGNMLQFRVTTQVADSSAVPASLTSITRFQASQAVASKDFTFSFDNQEWTINGRLYDPARIDTTSQLGTIYIWRLVNNSGEMHPFHKHLTQFQVLDIDGSTPPPEQMGWKDTVAVPERKTVRIIFKDETFSGTYVFHCHKLEHEDHRMMLQESTTP